MKEKNKSGNILIKSIWRPFRLCFKNKSKTVLWAVYVLFGGLLGVVINLISRCVFGGMSFAEAIYIESVGGTFYTYSVVLISATIGPLFFNLSESRVLHFATIKSFTITLCVFVMFFGAIFYSNCVKDVSEQFECDVKKVYSVDWSQLIFFVLAILFALYSLGLEYLEKDCDGNRDLDSAAMYLEKEENTVEDLKMSNPAMTDNGVRL